MGYSKQSEDFVIVPTYPRHIVPQLNFYGSSIRHGIFWGLNFGPGIFLGFVWSPRDFFGFWFLPPFNHPCHLKSRVPPPPGVHRCSQIINQTLSLVFLVSIVTGFHWNLYTLVSAVHEWILNWMHVVCCCCTFCYY